MKKIALILLLLVATAIAYCSLPLTSVATLTLILTDQAGRKVTSGAAANFLDSDGKLIVSITSTTPSSWDNRLQWWSHSSHETSTLRPGDAKRAALAEVVVMNCETAKVPVVLERRYVSMSPMPHGAGPAYFHYSFEQDVILQCK